MAMKETIVVCLDVGRSMWDPQSQGERGKSKLTDACDAVNLFLQQKIADGRRTEHIGIVVFGSDETDNELGYDNIAVKFPLQMASLDMIKYIQSYGKSSKCSSDWLDALVVAMDMIENHKERTAGWKTYGRRVIIVTDAAGAIKKDHMDTILDKLNEMQYKLQIFGLDFEDPDNKVKTMPVKTQSQLDNEDLLNEWATGGKVQDMDVIPMTEALERLSYFRSRSIRQTSLFRGFLEIGGDALYIPVHLYTKAAEAKPKSFKRIYVENDGTEVEVAMERTYKRLEDDEPVEKDDLVKAYKYGRTYVPFDKADEALVLQTNKCLQITGFVRSEDIPLSKFLGSSSSGTVEVDAQPDDPNATYALSALIHSLYELDRVAIARYKKTNGKGGASMMVLTPHITAKRECLFMTKIPFVEDIRDYNFVSLEKFKPTAEQQKSMDDLVDSLDLMTAKKDGDDFSEDLKPSDLPNVIIHRIQDAIKMRAIKGKSYAVKDSHPLLDKCLYRNERLFQHAKPAIDKFDSLWKDKTIKTAAFNKKDVQRQFAEAKEEDAAKIVKKVRLDEMDLAKLADQAVETVGSMDPIGDFRRIINQRNVDKVGTAMDQLGNIVKTLIANSFGDVNFDKALDALVEFRKVAIVEEESARFNDLLTALKEAPRNKPNNVRFWEKVARSKVSLISNDEADDSLVSTQVSQSFIEVDAVPKQSVKVEASVGNDSLLDEME